MIKTKINQTVHKQNTNQQQKHKLNSRANQTNTNLTRTVAAAVCVALARGSESVMMSSQGGSTLYNGVGVAPRWLVSVCARGGGSQCRGKDRRPNFPTRSTFRTGVAAAARPRPGHWLPPFVRRVAGSKETIDRPRGETRRPSNSVTHRACERDPFPPLLFINAVCHQCNWNTKWID